MLKKIAALAVVLLAFNAAQATVITHTNNPSNVSSWNYIYFSHNNAFDSALGSINSLEIDLLALDIDRSTNLQAQLGGIWQTVGSFGTGPSVWKWFNVGLGASVIAELESFGSLDFRFNEAQSSSWYATYDQSTLTIDYTAVSAPGSLALLGLGLVGLGFARKRSV